MTTGPLAAARPVAGSAARLATLAPWLGGALTAALLAALLVTLAYQVQRPLRLTIGDETSDKGVVRDFYADERRDPDNLPFRWTRGFSSIVLPAWGPGPYLLRVEMGAPLNPEPFARVLVNGQPAPLVAPVERAVDGRVRLTPDFATYEFAVPAALAPSGDVNVIIDSPTFSPPADRRRLGVAVHAVELTPAESRWPIAPPPAALVAGVGLALLAYATLVVAGWGWRASLLGASGLTAALAALLAGGRLFIAPVLEELLGIGALALAMTALVRLGLAGLARWRGVRLPPTERAWLLTLIAAALLVRLAATLHPQMDIIDIGFHVNRYTDVAERGMLFLRVASAEWGGRETTYSPASYLTMEPLGWLIRDKHRMIRFYTALLETSRALLLFALARYVSGSGRAALLATALFVSLPIAVLPFSWGIASNLFGEWWATALLLTLTVGWRRLTRPVVAGLAIAVATLALLAHPGLLLLTGAWLALLVGGLLAAWLLARFLLLRRRAEREAGGGISDSHHPTPTPAGSTVAALAAVVALAVVLAFALFYRVDAAMMLSQGGGTIAQRLSGAPTSGEQVRRWRVSGSVDDKSLGIGARYVTDWRQIPLEGAIGYAREAWAYYWVWPLAAAVAGWWLLGGSERGRRFRWLALAWVGAASFFALAGLLLNLYVRYMLFLLPVVCVLAGVALDRLAARGRVGVGLTALLMSATVIGGFWLWHQRIVYFFH